MTGREPGRSSRDPGNHAGIGGLKVVAENGWFAARPSGTENIFKLYAESFCGAEHLQRLVTATRELVSEALKLAGRDHLPDVSRLGHLFGHFLGEQAVEAAAAQSIRITEVLGRNISTAGRLQAELCVDAVLPSPR